MEPSGRSEPLHIVFLSSQDPLNIRAFAGTPFYMARSLAAEFPGMEVVRESRPPWFGRFRRRVIQHISPRSEPFYWRLPNKLFAWRLARRWRDRRVVVIAVVASPLVAELARHLPVINVSDATFRLMRDFYPSFGRLSPKAANAAERCEAEAIKHSVHSSFSSEWAAESAIHHYGASPSSVSAWSWGCNLERVDRAVLEQGGAHGDECRLLFLGAEWFRKGGDVAVAASRLLVARGLPVRLDLVGFPPDDSIPPEKWISSHGFLNKSDEAEAERLRELIRCATFLFLPTRQDCTPMVFAEANAFGTPVVTRAVGGVGSVVRNGINGLVLSPDADPADFADAIESCWLDHPQYLSLRLTSRLEYEERLNWTVWTKHIARLILRLFPM